MSCACILCPRQWVPATLLDVALVLGIGGVVRRVGDPCWEVAWLWAAGVVGAS